MTPSGLAGQSEPAPAKINLALHVTGRRGDGYHLLDTLVVFADVGDRLSLEQAGSGLNVSVRGPFADRLPDTPDNLVERAARLLAIHAGVDVSSQGIGIVLEKMLPVAAGLGGGSADAAAALRLLNRHWHLDLDLRELAELGGKLGADVPMCVYSQPLRAKGIGDVVEPVAGLADLPLVLVNPGIPVFTKEVFACLQQVDNPPLPDIGGLAGGIAAYLRQTRNDLQAAAIEQVPEIAAVIADLEATPGCLLARMSGAGASVFALFETWLQATDTARALAAKRPGWWAAPTRSIAPLR